MPPALCRLDLHISHTPPRTAHPVPADSDPPGSLWPGQSVRVIVRELVSGSELYEPRTRRDTRQLPPEYTVVRVYIYTR